MDQLRERVLISRDSCPETAQTRGHRGRKRCEAAAERSRMAGWGVQSDSVSRGSVVQVGQALTIRPVADLLRKEILDRGNFETGRFLHLKSEISKSHIGPSRFA